MVLIFIRYLLLLGIFPFKFVSRREGFRDQFNTTIMKATAIVSILFFTLVFAYEAPTYEVIDDYGVITADRRGIIGTSNNLRPCGTSGQFNSQGNVTYFMTRCLSLNNTVDRCSQAWNLFYDTLTYGNTSEFYENSPDYSSFINFFNWKGYMQANNLQPIFYAGTGQCPDIVHSITALPGINLITLEDQSGPYMIANAAWCDQMYFNSTDGSCKNVTTWGHIPNGNSNPNNYQGAAFWGPASVHFGESTYGTVWALLKSYERGTTQYPAFNGIFRLEELPTIMNQTDVDSFVVAVISNPVQPTETCGSGSIAIIQNITTERWGAANTKCIVDPPCVLQFICDDPRFYNVSLVNEDVKCQYWDAIKNLGASTNCLCSTDTLSLNGDGSWNVAPRCPLPQPGSASRMSAFVAMIVLLVVLLLQ